MRLLRAGLASASLFAFVLSGACGQLKRAPEAETDGGDLPGDPDAATPPDGGTPPSDDAGADQGAPPADTPCDGDPWTKTAKSKPECAPRQVKVIDTDLAIDATGISIARAPSGRIGVSYNVEIDGQSGEMHFVTFVPTSPSFTPKVYKHTKGPFDHAGHRSRVAASAPDLLSILAHDVDDVTGSGEVVVLRSTAGGTPSAPETVTGGVRNPTELGFAIDRAGVAYAAIRVPVVGADGGGLARLTVRRKAVGGGWTALPDLATDLTPQYGPGVGASKLFADGAGQLHAALHYCNTFSHSAPRYHAFDGAGWTYRKTLDNAIPDGLSGFQPQLAVRGNRKWSAFFFRKALQSPPAKADLRLVSWEGDTEVPVVTVLLQSIPSNDERFPRYAVAMDVDRFGFAHVAYLTPSAVSEDVGTLTYTRQTVSSTGTIVWITDTIDNDVISASTGGWVDMVVDDNVRPHIAYVSGKDLKVRYATRYDR